MSHFELKTSRLILRDFNHNVIQDYLALYENPEYCRFYPAKDIEKNYQKSVAQEFISSAKQIPRTNYSLAITTDKNNQFIGIISLRLLGNQKADFGCGIDYRYQNKGYAKEALNEIFHHAFENLDLIEINAETHKDNLAAKHICTAFGFQLISENQITSYFKLKKLN